mmetsp:Transcript_4856/g.650  ORF Transcript_4856/g.650 Transcript_4856/m.650 type:complete len:153 (-) Transcript_4856:2989-3447(-)
MALPKHKSCFYPVDKSGISSSDLFPKLMSSSTFFKYSSECYPVGSKFFLKLTLKMVGDCGIIEILYLSSYKLTFAISTPSIKIYPPLNSYILIKASIMEDFPAPVLPIIAILLPPGHVKLRFYKTLSYLFLYFMQTLRNSISPLLIYSFSGF